MQTLRKTGWERQGVPEASKNVPVRCWSWRQSKGAAFPSEIFPCISFMLPISKVFTRQSSLVLSTRDGKEWPVVAKCKFIPTQQFGWETVAPFSKHPLTPERYQLSWIIYFCPCRCQLITISVSARLGVYVAFTDFTWVTPQLAKCKDFVDYWTLPNFYFP